MAWGAFFLFLLLMIIGLIYLQKPLMVKDYYFMGSIGLISSAFTLSKVLRDNQEDEERYNQMFRAIDYSHNDN